MGSGTYPAFTVVTPAGWNYGNDHFVDKNAAGWGLVAVSVWDVPRDPCHWRTTLRDPGPGGWGGGLAGRPPRDDAGGRDARGQSGKYLEWSVPQWVVTGGRPG
jgi:hypothetical protein